MTVDNKIDNEEYISVKEFYEYINKDCPGLIGINKLYDLVKKRSFPSLTIRRRHIILKKQAEEWLKNKCKQPFVK